jgi:ubiquinone/menaquinone biosynthesis C-methylase UbiE
MSARGTERNAVLYSQVNDAQVQYGKRLALTAGIKHGDKVLDMGCGTGELTTILSKIVGNETPVVGVDPDFERIKVAAEKHSSAHQNITFVHGNSSSQFLHRNERYYDVHFSNFVFQWLNSDEKEKFIKTAHKILKPGGRIAIQSHEGDNAAVVEVTKKFHDMKTNSSTATTPLYFVSKATTEALLRKAGFSILYSGYFKIPYRFADVEDFLAFFYASDYYDEASLSHKEKNDLIRRIVNDDGSVTLFDPTVHQIVAEKNE